MKKILLLIAAMSIIFVSEAQIRKATDESLDKHVLAVNIDGQEMSNLELQRELNLTEEQLIEVKKLNQKRYQQIGEIEQEFKDNDILRSKAIYSINLEADRALSLMLQPEQMRIFIELEGRQNAKFATEDEE